MGYPRSVVLYGFGSEEELLSAGAVALAEEKPLDLLEIDQNGSC